ncbi:hypothetical protein RRG08_015638 [Elysia crispata]|uniref:MD-2-related lipid-recognition domain-containing protein n=1 Tax=Elysia crispata TaxID=231223 RepID=A0AAE0Y872_9GAST|nr:hypothetical protein RRG08_015638 [Elysia crispata]
MKAAWFLLMSALAQLACASSSSSLSELSELEQQAHANFKKFVGFLDNALQGRSTESLFAGSFGAIDTPKLQRWDTVNRFVFTNCARPQDEIVVVNKVTVKPDPLKLPGKVTAGGSVTIKKKFGSPLKLALDVYYKVLGVWVRVPCVDKVGSCTYADFCNILKVQKCPPEILKAGLTCKCPFPAVRADKLGVWSVISIKTKAKLS